MDVQHWALDPLFSTFRHLFIATIHDEVQVVDREGIYELYLCERPIRKVFLLGTIIEMRLKSTREETVRVIFKLDDGTGVIECWKYYDTSDEATASLGLGDFIAAYGVLYIQNKRFIAQLSAADICRDVDMEALHNIECIYLWEKVYDQPFTNAVIEEAKQRRKSPLSSSEEIDENENNKDSEKASGSVKKNIFTCFCVSFIPDIIEEALHVQESFMYCACMARHHPLDPTGFIRIRILYLISEQYFSYKLTTSNNHSVEVSDVNCPELKEVPRLDGEGLTQLEEGNHMVLPPHPPCDNGAGSSILDFLVNLKEMSCNESVLQKLDRVRQFCDKLQQENVYGMGDMAHPGRTMQDIRCDNCTSAINNVDLLETLIRELHEEGAVAVTSLPQSETNLCAVDKVEGHDSPLYFIPLYSYEVIQQRIVDVALNEFLLSRQMQFSDLFSHSKENDDHHSFSAINKSNEKSKRQCLDFIAARAREIIPYTTCIPLWKFEKCLPVEESIN